MKLHKNFLEPKAIDDVRDRMSMRMDQKVSVDVWGNVVSLGVYRPTRRAVLTPVSSSNYASLK